MDNKSMPGVPQDEEEIRPYKKTDTVSEAEDTVTDDSEAEPTIVVLAEEPTAVMPSAVKEADEQTAADETENQERLSEFERRARSLMGGGAMTDSGEDVKVQYLDTDDDGPEFDDFEDSADSEGAEDAAAGDIVRPSAGKRKNVEPEERDYMPVRFQRNPRVGLLNGLMYATFVICLSIAIAVFAWMAASDVLALNKDLITAEVTLDPSFFTEETVDVKDENGNVTGTTTVSTANMDSVATVLKESGIINYKWLFKLYSNVSNASTKVDPGTYVLSTAYDYRALVKKMQAGSESMVQISLTFPEGFTMKQIFERLEENGVCTVEELEEAAANTDYSYTFLEGAETGDAGRLEGYLFPDTYFFYQGMQASTALNKFLSNFHTKTTEDMWANVQQRNMTLKQLITAASIVEKEAGNDNERYLIASVIFNRINAGMMLQMDSTVLYGCGVEGADEVTGTMMQDESNLYNTYIYQGLPPGPICNPGMASIRAAMTPADTQYYYFALNEETGLHEFFTNLYDFQNFVATQSYGQQ